MNDYVDPILRKYADLIQGHTSDFKRVYFGDPVRIGVSELPALVITKEGTQIGTMTNEEDRHDIRILFTVITDVRNTISDDKTMAAGINQLYNLIEGRDTGYSLKPTSLAGILRNNVELDVANNLRTDLSTASVIGYGVTLGKRSEDSWSVEGSVSITATFTQVR